MFTAQYLKEKHEAGLTYADYLKTGTEQQIENWSKIGRQISLTEAQRKLIGSFSRVMKVICVSGIWCGDCAQQGPLIQAIADASGGRIDLRWVDRDEHMDLQDRVMINAGKRVPVVVFCAEDYEPLGWYGDKTLNRYRAVAKRQLGPSCPLPGAAVADDELAATLADWLDEFERNQLILRLSGRLRKLHGD
ncbi:MAG: thioredoxin family protein [Phycisphaeraceae bacterium]|nr:thioredoxin family protein [Phycisphaeraceae bacterium]